MSCQAYVQQLETSRLKLIHLEQELDRARQQVLLSLFFFLKYLVDIMMYDHIMLQGLYASNRVDTNALSFSDNMCSGLNHFTFFDRIISSFKIYLFFLLMLGIVAFEMEYGHWVEEQNRQISELRTVLNGQVSDIELRLLVDNAMKHYFQLFRMKSAAAKLDVFYIMSGMWKTSAERFFLWIGGFRPSELLKVLRKNLKLNGFFRQWFWIYIDSFFGSG